MADSSPHHEGNQHEQPLLEERQEQQQQRLQGIGSQFNVGDVEHEHIPQALEEFQGYPRAADPQLGAVLGRPTTTDDNIRQLINSDTVANLSPVHATFLYLGSDGPGGVTMYFI
ncbi:hypothetical protein GGR52DRAFT_573463 [Hypoxylon sp. FL1284]|nr:hypothetical protein GGR52DRAFT_577443 [Hypoxylon sp. FL1284]KAI0172324.1 hypothetical protein GGR52DRAFT_573463 [Hypoxylon sp. FL1284]